HGHVGFVGAVHAWHADELAAGARHAAQPHERGGARRAQLLDHALQFGSGIGQDDPAAGVDHGPLGGQQHLHGLFDLALVTLGDRRVRTHADLALGRHILAGLQRDVFGNVDQHRAGPPRAGDIERPAHGLGQVFDVAHQEVVLDARTGDAHRVAFLERVFAYGRSGHLPADDDHGNRIHVGRGNAGDGIGDARTAGDDAHAHLLRCARVRIGGVHGSLLVTNQNVLELVLLENRVVDVQHRAAGIAENVLDAFFGQAAHDDIGAYGFHVVFLSVPALFS